MKLDKREIAASIAILEFDQDLCDPLTIQNVKGLNTDPASIKREYVERRVGTILERKRVFSLLEKAISLADKRPLLNETMVEAVVIAETERLALTRLEEEQRDLDERIRQAQAQKCGMNLILRLRRFGIVESLAEESQRLGHRLHAQRKKESKAFNKSGKALQALAANQTQIQDCLERLGEELLSTRNEIFQAAMFELFRTAE